MIYTQVLPLEFVDLSYIAPVKDEIMREHGARYLASFLSFQVSYLVMASARLFALGLISSSPTSCGHYDAVLITA